MSFRNHLSILTLGRRSVCGKPQSARPRINRETIVDQYSYKAGVFPLWCSLCELLIGSCNS